jgi:hypothetical protein
MLRARCISEGVRTVYPGIAVGVYTVEEVQDMQPEKEINPITPTAGAADRVNDERRAEIDAIAGNVANWMAEGSLTDAFLEIDNADLDADEKVYCWTKFDSGIRRQLKEEAARVRTRNAAKTQVEEKISEPQRKRLEARISELKLDRDAVKARCQKLFGKEHFADLDKEEYARLDSELDAEESAPLPIDTTVSAVAEEIAVMTFEQQLSIAELLEEKKIDKARLLAVAEKASGAVYLSLEQLPKSFYVRACEWVEKQK